ncbi:peptidase T [Staphylococcus pseudintermedius]|uniref:peptidase T n=1 Tax=Staphylococcus pseudintermedius TaxID=283734 RepID=UPI002928AC02|nr:peptidase T [Staphylococcus pseudintermedius]MCE5410324.1 peptidase T [Staphylococcus pseudintermedius]MCE5511068.1 peptidase T [Staphylococcus pseudintermedius]MCE5610303.1 peptidase T [Staphylococcus pseudintermedius]MCE5755407.1 peptidase T [Staphylococcus pseudintermedius]MDU9259100.1 peptidase T [Staphylococcus pseudintermedius]
MKEQIIERLSRYVKINTQSDPNSETTPSTERQWDLLHLLESELKAMGLDTDLDRHGYLFATLEANIETEAPTIGFLAHVDTSPDFNAANVNPQMIDNYDGGVITLGTSGREINPEVFPDILKVKGHTLMTTDGTSLLGADDKAGVVEIMEALQYLIAHPEIKHGHIRVGFTPDEEIGRGPHKFDVERFDADFAYTMDGSQLGELQFESFNAAEAKITFNGVNVHPGSAKDKMVNALNLANTFHQALPVNEVPEHTEGYEGFFHLMELNGNVEKATAQYIIRDHDSTSFENRKQQLIEIQKDINARYYYDPVHLVINDQYRNMAEKIKQLQHIIDIPKAVYADLNITPNTEPIRGGTDGSQLSFMGLPTPNLFTGCDNFHGPYEYASIDVMAQAVQVILGIVQKVAEK